MRDIKVSVIMAVYNAEKYVLESIQSAQNQTFKNLEIIICDDCSTDESLKIASDISDRRIIILRNDKNLGVSSTRNRCLEIATGDFISILDADDVWEPQKIEKQLSFFESHPKVGIVGTQVTEINADGRIIGQRNFPKKHRQIVDFRLWACPFLHSSIMVRMEAMIPYNPETKQAEDWELENTILLNWKGANLQDRLVKYRIHEKNLTTSKAVEQRNEAFKVVRQFENVRTLSHKDLSVFKSVFNYELDRIKQPSKAITVLIKVSWPNPFRPFTRARIKWLLSLILKPYR